MHSWQIPWAVAQSGSQRKHAPGQSLFSGELEQDCASSQGAGPAGEGSVAEEACVKDREKEKEDAKGGCLTTGV